MTVAMRAAALAATLPVLVAAQTPRSDATLTPMSSLRIERRDTGLYFMVDPVQPVWVPLHAEGPLSFFGKALPATFRFTTGADGQVDGFTGLAPEGQPVSGRRKTG